MARPVRVEYEGAVYHVTARGNERREIFRDDEDRRTFLATLEQAVRACGVLLHGFCLMPNHYHLLLETPRANLSQAMGWFQTTYTVRFNRRHRRSGHLFQGRYKAHLVEAEGYAMELLRYVHLNPVRPRDKSAPVPRESQREFDGYQWSSHQNYLGVRAVPSWLNTGWLSFFGRSKAEARREYRAFVGAAFGKSLESPWEHLHGGLILGGEKIKQLAQGIMEGSEKREEVAWVKRTEKREIRNAAASKLAGKEKNRCWKAWLRVHLGGEKRIDVARSLNYRDGSAITHLLSRLDEAIAEDPSYASRASELEAKFEEALSSFKR